MLNYRAKSLLWHTRLYLKFFNMLALLYPKHQISNIFNYKNNLYISNTKAFVYYSSIS